MIVCGMKATTIVAKAVLVCIAGKIVSLGIEWATDNIECLQASKPVINKIKL